VPDDRVLWAPFAVLRALRLVREGGLRAILATVPAYSSGVIGYWISRLTKLPLILDLRDPWTRDPYLPAATRFHAWLDARLEAQVVGHAARVIVISESMRRALARAYPEIDPATFVVVTNGYDAEAFERIAPRDRGGDFVLTYAGSLYSHHRASLRAVCAAWTELAGRTPELTSGARLELIGRCDPEIEEELAAWPKVRSEAHGYLPHDQSLRRLKGASALLLLIKDLDPERQVITIPGKLFEYVGTSRPILMIGPEGDAADIVRETGGRVLREVEGAAIAAALEDLMRAGPAPGRATAAGLGVEERRRRYDRLAGTARLAALLDEATPRP
jgi:glycosyltransferase involved in cell wall biosynthesis